MYPLAMPAISAHLLSPSYGGRGERLLRASLLVSAAALLLGALLTGHTALAAILATALCILAIGMWTPALARQAALVFLLLAPFASVTPFLKPSDHNWFAYTTLFALLALSVNLRRRQPLTRGLIFLLYALLNAAILVATTGSPAVSWQTTLVVPLAALAFYYLAFGSSQAGVTRFVNGFLAFAGVEAALGIMQSVFGWPVFAGQELSSSERNPLGYISSALPRAASPGFGTFAHFNGLGALLALATPLAFALWLQRRRSPWRAGLLLLLLAGLWCTYSRGSWAGAAAGIVVLFIARGSWARKTQLLAAAVILGIGILTSTAAIAYYSQSQNLTSRLQTWKTASAYAERNPENLILGYGYSYFQSQALTNSHVQAERLVSLHSWILQVPFELGFVGLILLVLFLAPPLRVALRRHAPPLQQALAVAVIGFLVGQTVDNSLLGQIGVFMFLLVGLLQRLQLADMSTQRSPDLAAAKRSR